MLAEKAAERLPAFNSSLTVDSDLLEDWPRPEIARPPWETVARWFTSDELDTKLRKAA